MLVAKPAGLFTQAAPGVPSLEEQLVEQLRARDQHPGRPFVGLPHRLDRATSGVLLIARNQRALARFGQQFQSRKVIKYYVAIVEGTLAPGVHVWDDYLRKVADQPRAEVVAAETVGAKLAQLRIEALASDEERTLALIQLLTGRMHQIRLQAAHRGHPIVGDRLYGSTNIITNQSTALSDVTERREEPHALHAFRLGFHHPQTAVAMSVEAPLPQFWNSEFPPPLLDRLPRLLEQAQLVR